MNLKPRSQVLACCWPMTKKSISFPCMWDPIDPAVAHIGIVCQLPKNSKTLLQKIIPIQ